jgi:hypothetical protein
MRVALFLLFYHSDVAVKAVRCSSDSVAPLPHLLPLLRESLPPSSAASLDRSATP